MAAASAPFSRGLTGLNVARVRAGCEQVLRSAGSRCYYRQVTTEPTLGQQLFNLFEAERRTRELHDALAADAEERRDELVDAVVAAIAAARDTPEEEQALRLSCLARVLGEIDGPDVADALIDILNSAQPEARHEAGEQLQGLGFDRFKEVALAVERAVERLPSGSLALLELPYLLIDIPEPGVVKLLARFLQHEDPAAVAAAIESLVELGDDGAIQLIAPLVKDGRTTQLEDGGEEATLTIGELASEALELLQAAEE